MDSKPDIDYPAAALRMIEVLAHHHQLLARVRRDPVPIPSRRLCLSVFGLKTISSWQVETRRRRIREVARLVADILRKNAQMQVQLVANGQGYWLTGDATAMARYAARRRRQGLVGLKAASQVKSAPQMAHAQGQASLFSSQSELFPSAGPAGPHRYRH